MKKESAQEMVNFNAFLTILAVFSAKQPLETKRRVLFDVYDQESSGCVTVDNFMGVLTVVSHMNPARQKVDSGAMIAFPPPDAGDSRMHFKQREGVDFQFSNIFDPSVSQDRVFDEVCLDIVHSALDGYNGTILAYGQTGSGKTYTITGGEHYADRGIIPRVLSSIFEEFEKRPNMRYSCYISYLEIYNENVYDLLDRSHTDRPIEEWTKVLLMDDDEGDMHFRNLGVFEAVSEEEALNLLFLGNMNRVTSDTPMNQRCSEVTVDVAVNSEVDTEKRLETVGKMNAELESTNAELQARTVKLENEIKTQALEFAKKEEEWGQRLAEAQEEAQAALEAVNGASDRDQSGLSDQKVDWMRCEEIVENLLLAGELPREELDNPTPQHEFAEARQLYEIVSKEIRSLGMSTALGCLLVLKENTFFASNTAAELQDLMNKQTKTVEQLEQRVLEQKREAELLKEQIRSVEDSHKLGKDDNTSSLQKKAHNGKKSAFHQRSSGSDTADSIAESNGSKNESDSEDDTEASENHQYSRPAAARLKEHSKKAKAVSRSSKISRCSECSSVSILDDTALDGKQTTVRGAALATGGVENPLPPPPGSPRKSGSDLIRKRMELLRTGSLFVKYGRYGRPHVRFVWCSADLEYLNYRAVESTNPKATIPTRSIRRVCIGQETRVFERAKQPARAPHCFSVEYEENRTLDLEIADGESPEIKQTKRSDWVEALQFLMKLKAVPHRTKSQSRDDSAQSMSSREK
ncbi:hypothetical protein PHYBOEH_001789 [Phytophthora boehmeriae]|uniref:Kinesin motor domain-containing protein n=1 Tax=Phytophthora boehmeriae TaxID=109152 RepID=A0A8T1XBF0_9STRA|nr:hypothetical protein PHYBOEH_001789 [Phytophthora boehmeriae]